MSSKRVFVVKCDRCGRQEQVEVSDQLNWDEFLFHQQHDDWGVVKYKATFLDLCPSCNEKYKAFFSDFAGMNEPEIGGPLDETR